MTITLYWKQAFAKTCAERSELHAKNEAAQRILAQ